ncbi:MAG: adenylate/guanylate cyclase [Chthonomonadaceae bacterium]|nr:adenylate/guanylate cyclase [Chthonomonadaceae bacterium]
MALKDDLKAAVAAIYKEIWTVRNGQVVPDETTIALGNVGVKLQATVLYADLADSTELVDTHTPEFAAEVYKTYLRCCGRIIRSEGGEITSYDGDRVMAVFLGDRKNTKAVRAALKINEAVVNVLRPKLKAQYPNEAYVLRSKVGIDTSPLMAAKAGIRGANDLVWIGRAANYAAKLATLNTYATYITSDVYKPMADEVAWVNGDRSQTNMWTPLTWNGIRIYGSDFRWVDF